MIAQHRKTLGGFLEAKIGGKWHVLVNGRWIIDPFHYIKIRNGLPK